MRVLTHLILTTNRKEVLLLVHFADEGTEAQTSLGHETHVSESGPGSGICVRHLGAARPLQSHPKACLFPDLPFVSSCACGLLLTLFLVCLAWCPPVLEGPLQGPSPRQASQDALLWGHSTLDTRQAVRSGEDGNHLDHFSIPDSLDVAGMERRLRLLTPEAALPMGGVKLQRGLGHIDAAL